MKPFIRVQNVRARRELDVILLRARFGCRAPFVTVNFVPAGVALQQRYSKSAGQRLEELVGMMRSPLSGYRRIIDL